MDLDKDVPTIKHHRKSADPMDLLKGLGARAHSTQLHFFESRLDQSPMQTLMPSKAIFRFSAFDQKRALSSKQNSERSPEVRPYGDSVAFEIEKDRNVESKPTPLLQAVRLLFEKVFE